MIIAVILWWVFFFLFVFVEFDGGNPPRFNPRTRGVVLAILLGILAVVTFGNPFAGMSDHSARHSN